MSDKPTSWICLKCQKFWRAYPQDVKCPECEATGDAVREEPDYWDNETRRMIAAQGDVIRRMREGCEKEWERIINSYTTLGVVLASFYLRRRRHIELRERDPQ